MRGPGSIQYWHFRLVCEKPELVGKGIQLTGVWCVLFHVEIL